ncbi:hypothetical protein SAMD00019534_080110 [Acytostelium subglobosum LB1]|uniref:hypothetical protein n=1 Tax=Acytostelium subglobosum LB1 TaxID=1410327 RepID=UPI000644A186|nr:hypothetical protein SAMD00019534_080110 [Acytostelium subglobosum LB1]GAM24836.1 hypothetical protein SAMD00019534_080110 [Acytostelium subglobosum LB1]|eukprot:XP_012752505.1 hypothetical protein SAMD00019534_080110 [Acytostelium subglobosum LB1]
MFKLWRLPTTPKSSSLTAGTLIYPTFTTASTITTHTTSTKTAATSADSTAGWQLDVGGNVFGRRHHVTSTTTSTTSSLINNDLSNIDINNININNNINNSGDNNKSQSATTPDSKEEKRVDDDLVTHCIEASCHLPFKVPAKLRGMEGYCPRCATKQTFKKHTSSYQRLLRRRRDQYMVDLEAKTKVLSSLDLEKSPPSGISVLLDDCRSLANTGSVFRSCDGAGFSHVYLCGITGSPPNEQISKTALGAEEFVPWSYAESALYCVRELKSKGVKIVGIEQDERSMPLLEQGLDHLVQSLSTSPDADAAAAAGPPPICLLFGNEVGGLSPEVIDECDYIFDLPMRGQKISLNIAVSFGIVAYVVAQRFPTLLRINKITTTSTTTPTTSPSSSPSITPINQLSE